jgi:N-methylhydantoinase B
VDEQKYPIHVYEQRLVPDSEGAGRQRGGLGTRTVYGPKTAPVTVAYSCEAHHNPPKGVRGGRPGGRTDTWTLDAQGNRVDVDLVGALQLQPGERIVSISSGGGGYGEPLERDPALVLHDVQEGWVSAARARDVYGVVLAGDDVDAEATRRLREELTAGRGRPASG